MPQVDRSGGLYKGTQIFLVSRIDLVDAIGIGKQNVGAFIKKQAVSIDKCTDSIV